MGPAHVEIHPSQLPGTCFRCLAGDSAPRDYFVDTGSAMDFYGVVYLCSACLEDLVRVTPDFYHKNDLDRIVANHSAAVAADKATVVRANAVMNGLALLGFDIEQIELLAISQSAGEAEKQALREAMSMEQIKVSELSATILEQEAKIQHFRYISEHMESVEVLKEKFMAERDKTLALEIEVKKLSELLQEAKDTPVEVAEVEEDAEDESPPSSQEFPFDLGIILENHGLRLG